MIIANAATWLLLVFGAGAEGPAPTGVQYAQVTVRQQIIIRLPQARPLPAASMVHWRESRGPRCIAARAVAGATLPGANSVDLVMRDNSRVRAHLAHDCPGLDFYRGFYVNGNPDGLICADRDAIRSRMGGQCGIDQFRSLTAVRP
jgi:hypothetical protein